MDRKEARRKYKETARPAGVYRVLRKLSGRALLGASPDAPAMLNRIQAQLRMRSHPNRQLQADWASDGPEGFSFEVLDLLPPLDSPGQDPSDDLDTLVELWRDKLDLRPEDSY